jgi:hypothetical protein
MNGLGLYQRCSNHHVVTDRVASLHQVSREERDLLRLFRPRGGRNHHQSTTPPFHILDTVCIREAHGKRRGLLESLVYCTLGWAGIRIREDRSSVLRTTILGLRVLTA